VDHFTFVTAVAVGNTITDFKGGADHRPIQTGGRELSGCSVFASGVSVGIGGSVVITARDLSI